MSFRETVRTLRKNKITKFIGKYAVITFAATLYAVAISLFLDPNNLAPGGISGIAIILKAIIPGLPIGVGMIILIFNIPIMLLGLWKFGFKFVISTLYTLVVSSVLIDVIPTIIDAKSITDEPILAALAGGALFGISLGTLFRMETTSGGVDVIIKVIRQKVPHLKTGQIYIVMDAAVLTCSALAFRNIEVALFAGVAIYVSSMVMDKVIYGSDEATLVYIISEKREDIAKIMLEELDLGVTFVQGVGAYTKKDTEIIMCVMRKQTLTKVRNILKKSDPYAFMIITSANEVFGEGFKDPYKIEV